MEAKKNSKANLEKMRGIFFLTGLVIAMTAMMVAFNVSTETKPVDILTASIDEGFEETAVIQTQPEDKKIIPPPPTKELIDILTITDDPDAEDMGIPVSSESFEDDPIIFKQPTISKTIEVEEDPIFIPAVMPQFPGGDFGLRKYLADHVIYPPKAIEEQIEGKVYVRFCVNSKGLVDRVSIARGIDPLLDNEAIRVVKALPKWKPGENNGRKVSVWYTVPINFRLK